MKKTDTEILTKLLEIHKTAAESAPYDKSGPSYLRTIRAALEEATEQRLMQTGDDPLTLSILERFKKHLNDDGYVHLPPDSVLKPELSEAISMTRVHLSDELVDIFDMLALRVAAKCRLTKGSQNEHEKAYIVVPEGPLDAMAVSFEGFKVVNAAGSK